MAQSDIRVGTVVELKSGGPPMTVDALEDVMGTPYAHCSWFDGNKPLNGQYPLTSLRAYEE